VLGAESCLPCDDWADGELWFYLGKGKIWDKGRGRDVFRLSGERYGVYSWLRNKKEVLNRHVLRSVCEGRYIVWLLELRAAQYKERA